MKTDIPPLVCLLFWERAPLMATVWFCFQSDEKPPPGSQLLVAQQVSHVCHIVLFANLKTGGHVAYFSEICCFHKGSVCSIPILPRKKHPPSRLRIKTERCRANASLSCIALIMKRFHLTCEANQEEASVDKCLHMSSSICTNRLPTIAESSTGAFDQS